MAPAERRPPRRAAGPRPAGTAPRPAPPSTGWSPATAAGRPAPPDRPADARAAPPARAAPRPVARNARAATRCRPARPTSCYAAVLPENRREGIAVVDIGAQSTELVVY